MQKIRDGVYFIPGQDEMIPDSHTYVIGDPSTKEVSLIDPGLTGKGNTRFSPCKNWGSNWIPSGESS